MDSTTERKRSVDLVAILDLVHCLRSSSLEWEHDLVAPVAKNAQPRAHSCAANGGDAGYELETGFLPNEPIFAYPLSCPNSIWARPCLRNSISHPREARPDWGAQAASLPHPAACRMPRATPAEPPINLQKRVARVERFFAQAARKSSLQANGVLHGPYFCSTTPFQRQRCDLIPAWGNAPGTSGCDIRAESSSHSTDASMGRAYSPHSLLCKSRGDAPGWDSEGLWSTANGMPNSFGWQPALPGHQTLLGNETENNRS